jgi:hypothetical protein
MEEMIYSINAIPVELHRDTYKGFDYKIINYGSHPCVYVRLPKGHKYYKKSYITIPIRCHGGITYAEMEEDGFWIGWDYGHSFDYNSFIARAYENLGEPYDKKKWTTIEMKQDAEFVIDQLL